MGQHHWKARLGVSAIMLLLAFLGMIITDIRLEGGWEYWKWVVPVYAILSLWLSWYLKRDKHVIAPVTIGHELLHWGGVVGAVFMISYFIHLGLVSRFIAGIVDLLILSLGVFLAGVYIESTFLLIGIVLGILAWMSAVLVQYLYAIMIPILLGALAVISLMVWISHRKTPSS